MQSRCWSERWGKRLRCEILTVSFWIRRSGRAVGELPLWRGTSLGADACKSELGASDYLVQAIRY